MSKAVSVLITSHNSSELLRSAIDSVINQSRPPAEILIVDDGSNQPTSELLSDYLEQVRIIRRKNGGQGAATNTAIDMASYDLIAILDHDDYWPPDKLEWQVNTLVESDADVVVGAVVNEWHDPTGEIRRDEMGVARVFGSCLIHRRAFEIVGGLDESGAIHEVFDWWSRAGDRLKVVTDSRVALYRRIHGKNLTLESRYQDRADLFARLRTHITKMDS